MTTGAIGAALENNPDAEPPMQVFERAGVAGVRTALDSVRVSRNLAIPPAELLPLGTSIQKLAAIADRAGERPVPSEGVQRMFDRLGMEVYQRML